jgi:hypothetical protein
MPICFIPHFGPDAGSPPRLSPETLQNTQRRRGVEKKLRASGSAKIAPLGRIFPSGGETGRGFGDNRGIAGL